MILWGGTNAGKRLADGWIYVPSTDTWTSLPSETLSGRTAHGAAYSAAVDAMFIWGGLTAADVTADGAEYNVATKTWTALPAAPIEARSNPRIFADGSDVIIYGGTSGAGVALMDGAVYSTASKTWRKLDAPTGVGSKLKPIVGIADSRLIVLGGVNPGDGMLTNDGAFINLAVGASWVSIMPFSKDVFAPRVFPAVFTVAESLYIWSGAGESGYLDGGSAFSIVGTSFAAMSTVNAPIPRQNAAVASTGKCGLVWGGAGAKAGDPTKILSDGALYCP
jgi:hypothetical protein